MVVEFYFKYLHVYMSGLFIHLLFYHILIEEKGIFAVYKSNTLGNCSTDEKYSMRMIMYVLQ